MLAVRLNKALELRLSTLANKTNRTKSFYVKRALEKLFEEEEERYLALQAYEDFLESGKKTTSFAEVMRENGLEGNELEAN